MRLITLTLILPTILLAATDSTSTGTGGFDLGDVSITSILAGTISILTLMGFVGAAIKKLIAAAALESRVDLIATDVNALKSDRDTQTDKVSNLIDAIRSEMANKVSINSYDELKNRVDAEMNKLTNTVNELSQIELKLNEMKSHFDESNTERKEEIKELNDTIKDLRDNIREDINDVKSVIMKLMMNLKIKDTDD
jgi:uncharacterized coiled-coil DUF342 family protein